MNRRLYFILTISVFIVINCPFLYAAANENGIELSNNKKLILKVDLKKETKLQEEVDAGHEPWRLEAIDVAYEAIIRNVDKNAEYENCSLLSETQNEALIKFKGEKTYLVTVKKLAKPNKKNRIWTAVEIEKINN
jgi:hypothetical protein